MTKEEKEKQRISYLISLVENGFSPDIAAYKLKKDSIVITDKYGTKMSTSILCRDTEKGQFLVTITSLNPEVFETEEGGQNG